MKAGRAWITQHIITGCLMTADLPYSPVFDSCKRICATPGLAHVIADQHISRLCAQKEPLLTPNVLDCTGLCIARPYLGIWLHSIATFIQLCQPCPALLQDNLHIHLQSSKPPQYVHCIMEY